MPAKKSTTKRKKATKKTTTAKTKKAASPKTRATNTKAKAKAKKKSAGDKQVTIDRRRKADRRDATAQKTNPTVQQPQIEKREKVQRRRQIDPTTCERDYSEQEVEFMNAMDEYKRTSGRMFPTCSEVLEVIRDLGYVQLTPAEIAVVRPELNEDADESEDSPATADDVKLETTEMTA